MSEPEFSFRSPHEVKKTFAFLGTKGRDCLLDLIATLLVLQFLRTKLEQEGMVAKSLMKMDDTFISRCFNVLIRNFSKSHSTIVGLFQTTLWAGTRIRMGCPRSKYLEVMKPSWECSSVVELLPRAQGPGLSSAVLSSSTHSLSKYQPGHGGTFL